MKKFAGLCFAAILGGLVAVSTLKLTETEKKAGNAQENQKSLQQSGSNLVNLPVALPEAAIDFSTAAELSVNAVVHVQSVRPSRNVHYQMHPFHDFFFGNPGQREMPKAMTSGSGVIISSDGYIVTNNHVIDKSDELQIILNNKKQYKAEIIGTDPETDIALLKIDEDGLPYIPYANSDDVKVGEWVLAVGNPFNLTSTVTAGIVSAKGRSINILSGDMHSGISPVESFIQTDAAVNPGNSGGALVNITGELVGINTAIKSNTGSYTGYSFAVPVNIVSKVVDDLLEYGTVQRAFIGVQIRDIDADFAEENKIAELSGVYVNGLSEDGAALEAGIKEGDVIKKIGNVTVRNVPELQEQISRFRPGEKIMVTLKREGNEKEVPVVLRNKWGSTELVHKEIPETFSMLGAEFETITKEEQRKLGINNGVKIKKLNGGKLRSAGIREGFIVTRIDKKPVKDTQDMANALKNKKGGVLIEGVYGNGMSAYYGFGM